MTAQQVDFWFDFVSGYSWIAFLNAAEFARENQITWRLRPFVLGAIIKQLDRRTAAQLDATRGYAHFDVARLAHHLGAHMGGPKQHPFVSLRALRAQILFQDQPEAFAVARSLFAACWERGEDLTETEVVLAAVESAGATTEGLADRIAARETKDRLHQNTDEALARGVFGAPFFFFGDEPFWGQDRLPILAARLGGKPGMDPERQRRYLAESRR